MTNKEKFAALYGKKAGCLIKRKQTRNTYVEHILKTQKKEKKGVEK